MTITSNKVHGKSREETTTALKLIVSLALLGSSLFTVLLCPTPFRPHEYGNVRITTVSDLSLALERFVSSRIVSYNRGISANDVVLSHKQWFDRIEIDGYAQRLNAYGITRS